MDAETKAEIKEQESGTCETAIDLEINKQTMEFYDYCQLQFFAKAITPTMLSKILIKAHQGVKTYKEFLRTLAACVNQWVEQEVQSDVSESLKVVQGFIEGIWSKFIESMDDLRKLMKDKNISKETIEVIKNRNMITFKAWVDQFSAYIK